MNTSLFVQIIKELLLLYKKVEIPKFGEFIAETAPSFLSSDGLTIYPPSKRIYFRQDFLKKDDGRLCEYYSRREGVSLEKANQDISALITTIRELLQENRKFELENFGLLKYSGDSDLIFTMDRELDVYAEDFSLQPVHLKYKSKNNVGLVVENDIFRKIEEISAEEQSDLENKLSSGTVQEAVHQDVPVSEAPVTSAQETFPAEQETPSAEVSQAEHKSRHKGMKIALLVIAVLLILFVILELSGISIMDQMLYSSEELELMNSAEVGH